MILSFFMVIPSSLMADYLFQPTGGNFMVASIASKQYILSHYQLGQSGILKDFRALSSGKRINSAGDDPAGLAVSEKLTAMVNQIKTESMNKEMLRDYYRLAEGAIANNHGLVKEIRAEMLKATSPLMGKQEKQYIQAQIDQYLDQIDMNAQFTQFNKKQVIAELSAAGLNLQNVSVTRDFYGSLKRVDTALDLLVRRRAIKGIKSNVLEMEIKGKQVYLLNATASLSRQLDADIAYRISALLQKNTLAKFQYGLFAY